MRISSEQIDISKIRKQLNQLQPLPRWAKKIGELWSTNKKVLGAHINQRYPKCMFSVSWQYPPIYLSFSYYCWRNSICHVVLRYGFPHHSPAGVAASGISTTQIVFPVGLAAPGGLKLGSASCGLNLCVFNFQPFLEAALNGYGNIYFRTYNVTSLVTLMFVLQMRAQLIVVCQIVLVCNIVQWCHCVCCQKLSRVLLPACWLLWNWKRCSVTDTTTRLLLP